MNIGVVGLGYVGLTFSVVAANKGICTHGVEINDTIKGCLKNNRAHFFEPGLDSMIESCNGKTFFVDESFPGSIHFDAFMITVGTPLMQDKNTPNFDYIKQALNTIAPVYHGTELIVLRSTVSVGTTRNVIIPLLSDICQVSDHDILISFCPERTIEGKAVEELTQLPQIISGNNPASVKLAEDLFREITPYVIKVSTLEEAELIKLYNNTYRDIMFAVGNAFCFAAQGFGVDGNKIIKIANQGYTRANIALPGFVGGPCLEKDAYILTNNMTNSASRDFILSARRFNESVEDIVVKWVEEEFQKDETIAVSGMAFKGIPDTSDLRGSNSVNIVMKLKEKGFKLHIHDYVANRQEMEGLGLGTVFDDIYDAIDNTSLLLILNNNIRYKELDLKLIQKSKAAFCILDIWNSCKNIPLTDKIKIYNIGNMFL